MIDSHLGTPVAHGGNITISEMAFIDSASSENPEEGDDPVTPPEEGDDPVTPPEEEDPVTPPEEEDPVTPPEEEDPVTPPEEEDPVTPPEEEEPAVTEQKVTINGADIAVDGNLAPDGPYTATVNAEKTELNVTYTNMEGGTWFNVALQGISDIAGAHNAFNAQIKNNGAENVLVRVDICAASGNIINLSATQDGVGVNTDLVNGGSFFTVAPGATVTIQVVYDGSKAPAYALFMLDSSTYQDTNVYNGNVTISAMSFADVTVTPPEEEDPVTPPEEQPSDTVTINGTAAKPQTDAGFTATVDSEKNAVNVVYADVNGNAYSGIRIDGISSVVAENNTLTLKITNNGDTAVNVRVDVLANIPDATYNHNKCNLSSTMNGEYAYTDLQWGGSIFDGIAPGATVTIVITYDNEREPYMLMFMFDTHKGDTSTHSGNVTISEIAFSDSTAE